MHLLVLGHSVHLSFFLLSGKLLAHLLLQVLHWFLVRWNHFIKIFDGLVARNKITQHSDYSFWRFFGHFVNQANFSYFTSKRLQRFLQVNHFIVFHDLNQCLIVWLIIHLWYSLLQNCTRKSQHILAFYWSSWLHAECIVLCRTLGEAPYYLYCICRSGGHASTAFIISHHFWPTA